MAHLEIESIRADPIRLKRVAALYREVRTGAGRRFFFRKADLQRKRVSDVVEVIEGRARVDDPDT